MQCRVKIFRVNYLQFTLITFQLKVFYFFKMNIFKFFFTSRKEFANKQIEYEKQDNLHKILFFFFLIIDSSNCTQSHCSLLLHSPMHTQNTLHKINFFHTRSLLKLSPHFMILYHLHHRIVEVKGKKGKKRDKSTQ